ncbi:MAG: hypothetical protein NTX45_07290 [Proteobacteria bacterium]|nr:hypothetical protein [Pseudomonadota bacterium]
MPIAARYGQPLRVAAKASAYFSYDCCNRKRTMPYVFNWMTSLFTSAKTPDGSGAAASSGSWQLSLDDAVGDATSLLAFASRNGITLDPEQMKPIIEMARLLEHDNEPNAIDAEQEQKFWQTYSAVVARIRPVTSDSINATLEYHGNSHPRLWNRRTIAQKTVFRYGVCSLVVLVSIIYFQSYMQMGITIRSHLQTAFYGQSQAIDELFLARIAEEDARLKAAGQEGQENFYKKILEKYKVELEVAKLRASQDEMYAWSRAGDLFLSKLGMSSGMTDDDRPKQILKWLAKMLDEIPRKSPDLQLKGPNGQPTQSQTEMESDVQRQLAESHADSLVMAELRVVVIPTYLALNESEQILRLISQFILPLLYGLLGACAYVLRDLTNTIGAVTFSKSTMINYNLRLIMGPLVGIAVGLFFGSSAANLVGDVGGGTPSSLTTDSVGNTSIGTMGLAFLAGYSIEVLFSALETLVSAFAGNRPPPKKDDKKAD